MVDLRSGRSIPVSAREIVQALGGNWHGSYGTARYPAHEDKDPSLSVSECDVIILVKCHERLHRLGPRAVDELLLEIGAERYCLTVIEDKLACYAELDSSLASAVGGDRFPELMLMMVST